MKITDLRCAVIGRHPIVRITTDAGISGIGEVEFTKPYIKPFVLHFRDALIGEEGEGWKQVTAELAFEPGEATATAAMPLSRAQRPPLTEGRRRAGTR